MSSLVPDQHQAQVPVAVEEGHEPQGQLTNSTSGAAYELETSGDGEARQMAASNDDTADLFGSPLQELAVLCLVLNPRVKSKI